MFNSNQIPLNPVFICNAEIHMGQNYYPEYN